MRTPLKLSLATLATAIAVTACGDARATEANEDLKRDLALASSTVSLAAPRVDSALLNSMETKPQGAPEPAKVLKRAPGPKAIRSSTPTVRATPVVEVAAEESLDDVVETVQEAPAPEISEPVAVAPRPQPVIVQTGGVGDYGTGNGGIYGGGTGVIIRGGGIDGDNCELHRRGRGGSRGGIFVPQQPTYPNTGGVVVTRAPRGTSSGIGSRTPGAVSRTASESRRTSEASSRAGTFRTARGIISPRGR